MSDGETATDAPHPDRVRLEALVRFGEKRLQRASERQASAVSEYAAARAALLRATASLVDWIEAHPDPQLPLPLVAASKQNGDHL